MGSVFKSSCGGGWAPVFAFGLASGFASGFDGIAVGFASILGSSFTSGLATETAGFDCVDALGLGSGILRRSVFGVMAKSFGDRVVQLSSGLGWEVELLNAQKYLA